MSSEDDREARLPRWAQKELASLRRRVTDAEDGAQRARLATDPAGSNTLLDPYAETPIGLGHGETVRFILGAGSEEYIDAHVRRDPITDQPYLELMAGRMIVASPRASNVLRVWATSHH